MDVIMIWRYRIPPPITQMMPLGLCTVLYPCLFSSVKGTFGLLLMQGKLTYGKIGEWRFDKRSYTKVPPPRNLTLPPPGVPESVVWLSQLAFMSILSCLTYFAPFSLLVMFTHKFIHTFNLVRLFLNSTWYTYYKLRTEGVLYYVNKSINFVSTK